MSSQESTDETHQLTIGDVYTGDSLGTFATPNETVPAEARQAGGMFLLSVPNEHDPENEQWIQCEPSVTVDLTDIE